LVGGVREGGVCQRCMGWVFGGVSVG